MLGRAIAVLSLFVLLTLVASSLPGTALADAASSAERNSTQVVVQGNPPLTQGMVVRFTDFFEWIVEAPLTVEQRDRMRTLVVTAWQQNSKSDMDGVVEILKNEAQVASMPAEQRDVVRAQVQPEFLKALKADSTEEFNRWLLEIYDTAHAPIAGGNPPLTRQISDAEAEMFAFMLSEASGQKVEADQQYKDDFARWLTQAYPALPPETQAKWAQSPVLWASLRVVWSQMDAKGRADLRKQWSESLGGALPQVRDRGALEAALNDLDRLTGLRKQREWTPAEIQRAAKDMDEAARILRKDGGEAGAAQAVKLEQGAQQLRQIAAAGPAPASSAPPPGTTPAANGKETVAQMMARERQQHNMFMSMMNMSMQNYYSNINVINTLGGSPYRYVNAYGH